jgi:selenocysteine lyase/cysteine desulfurase
MQPDKQKAIEKIRNTIFTALETYSNVHRGSGHFALITTAAFEKAREIVLEYLGLTGKKHVVIFSNLRRAEALVSQFNNGDYQLVSSGEFGLSLGVTAIAVKREALRKEIRFQSGGGTARLISSGWVIWEKAPERFEAGTPAVINIIAFAAVLKACKETGIKNFRETFSENSSVQEILYRDELENLHGPELFEELRRTLIGKDIRVPTGNGAKPYINFDNAASTPAFLPVFAAASKALCLPHNKRQEVHTGTRVICSRFLNAPLADYDILFTSNTTESINIVAESLASEPVGDFEPVVVNSLLEHNSNDLPWRTIPGALLIRLPIDKCGIIDTNELENLLREYNSEGRHGRKRIRLVAVSGASNVLGVFNDIETISRIVHKYHARVLVDAAQMVAHRSTDIRGSGVDFMAFSAHKVYAPFGCGVLVARKGLLNFNPAELAKINTSGEENTMGIAALGKSLVLLERIGMDLIQKREHELTVRLLHELSQVPGVHIFGITDPGSEAFDRKGGVVVFRMKGFMPDRIARKLALHGGIGIRYGCHCSHILIKHLLGLSPILIRFQYMIVKLFPQITLPGLARVSLGIENTEDDILAFIHVMKQIAEKHEEGIHNARNAVDEFVNQRVEKIYSKD